MKGMKMQKSTVFLFAAFVWIIGTLLPAASADLTIPLLRKQPVVDGKSDDACWKNLQWQSGFFKLGGRLPAQHQTRFKAFHDNWKLYLLIECGESDMKSLVTRTGTAANDQNRWKDDSIEINLVPDQDARNYYKWLVNPSGGVTEIFLSDDNTGTSTFKHDWSFRSGIEVKTASNPDSWTAEAAIPLHGLDLNGVNTVWRFNIGRNRYAAGPRELSSFSPLSWPRHELPGEFKLAELQNLKLNKFLWESEFQSGAVSRNKSDQLVADLRVQLTNETGDFALAGIRAELFDQKDQPVSSFTDLYPPKSFIFRKMRPVPLKMTFPKNGKYTVRMAVVRVDGRILSSRNHSIELNYKPVSITVKRPVYRNCIFATMPDKRFTAEIQVDPQAFSGTAVKAEFTGGGKTISRELALKNHRAIFEYDMKDMPDGTYFLRCGGENVKLRKLPYLKGEVWFGEDGGTRVDGKPFVPYGWAGGVMRDPAFNVFSTGFGATRSEAFLDWFAASRKVRPDVKLIATPFCEKERTFPFKIFHYTERKNRLTAVQRELIAKHLAVIGKDPSLFCYNGSDEPEGKDNIPEWYSDVRDAVEEFDPYHPILILNEDYSSIDEYARGGDVRMPDCYVNFLEPDTSRRPLYTVSHYTRKARQYGPGWLMPQGFCWNLSNVHPPKIGRPPTFDEMRNQAWQVFANDGKGVIWYATKEWSWLYDQIPIASSYIGQEVKLLTEYIVTSPDRSLKVQTEPADPNFQAMLKRIGNKIALFAVNTSRDPIQAKFRFENGPKLLHVLGEERTVKCSGGFSDRFAPLETHVYTTDAPPENFETLRQCKARLAAVQQARFTPGNLIGSGPLTRQVYIDIGKGKIPENLPVLTASSQHRTVFTQKVNTLYFLLDGLRPETPDQNSIYNAWMPLPKDRKPWLQIRLPKEAEVREFRLYAMRGKGVIQAEDLAIQIRRDGKWEELAAVKNNQAHRIVIPLQNVRGNHFRIVFNKLRSGGPRPGRLLSEVEIIGAYR